MRDHAAGKAAVLIAASTLLLAGCSGGSGGSKATPKTAAKDTPGQGGAQAMVELPDLTGKDLATATATAKQLGFASIGYHDAVGKNRAPVPDKTWKVCDQTPKPGPSSVQDKVDFGAVPSKENCLAQPTVSAQKPTGAPTKASSTGGVTTPPRNEPTRPDPRPTTKNPFPTTIVFYRNCAEARAAGAAPLHVGEPGYSRMLDRDGDGVACDRG
ncbi:hypothetical protein GCM10023205_46980 [Yinghuangia aomiensis]|uniref:Excalibur calcium-binding domain-containing protein n=1 Tax=Yinghuangia aomiensis TaxID=676205 RepID=A0ABP9HNW8_9ACTN